MEKSFRCNGERETVSEGGDEHFSPNWHDFLRGRRREGVMLTTTHGMAFDLIPSELVHRHEQRLLVHKERNDGGGKRTNVQERDLSMAQRLRNGVFLQGLG